jgi:hypothetical protein
MDGRRPIVHRVFEGVAVVLGLGAIAFLTLSAIVLGKDCFLTPRSPGTPDDLHATILVVWGAVWLGFAVLCLVAIAVARRLRQAIRSFCITFGIGLVAWAVVAGAIDRLFLDCVALLTFGVLGVHFVATHIILRPTINGMVLKLGVRHDRADVVAFADGIWLTVAIVGIWFSLG